MAQPDPLKVPRYANLATFARLPAAGPEASVEVGVVGSKACGRYGQRTTEVVVMQRPHSQWATQGEEVDQRLTAFQRDIVHVCLHLVTDQLRPAQIAQIIACDDRPE